MEDRKCKYGPDSLLITACQFLRFGLFPRRRIEMRRQIGCGCTGRLFHQKNIAAVRLDYKMFPTAVDPQCIMDAAAAAAWVYKRTR